MLKLRNSEERRLVKIALNRSGWFKQEVEDLSDSSLEYIAKKVDGLIVGFGLNHTYDRKTNTSTPNEDYDAVVLRRADAGVYVANIDKKAKK